MPQQNDSQQSSLIPFVLIVGALIWWANSGTSKPIVPPAPDDQHETDPQPVVSPAESEYWSAIAQCVEKSSFGVLQQHTDHLLQIVDILKATGTIKDDSRVSAWRAKRVEITDANRAEVSKTLRGI